MWAIVDNLGLTSIQLSFLQNLVAELNDPASISEVNLKLL